MIQSTVWTLVKKMLRAARCRPKNGSDFTQSGTRIALRRRIFNAGRGIGRSDEDNVEMGSTPLRDDGSDEGSHLLPERTQRTPTGPFRVRSDALKKRTSRARVLAPRCGRMRQAPGERILALRMALALRSFARRRSSHGFS